MEIKYTDYGDNFQTPIHVCHYMNSLIPEKSVTVLDPTPGKGNLEKSISVGRKLIHYDTFDQIPLDFNVDCIVMNPPFSPMILGYKILYRCMEMSDEIIALMPYLTIINSQRRLNDIMDFGLISITNLPRSTFKGSRVQTCILRMSKGYKGKTEFIKI